MAVSNRAMKPPGDGPRSPLRWSPQPRNRTNRGFLAVYNLYSDPTRLRLLKTLNRLYAAALSPIKRQLHLITGITQQPMFLSTAFEISCLLLPKSKIWHCLGFLSLHRHLGSKINPLKPFERSILYIMNAFAEYFAFLHLSWCRMSRDQNFPIGKSPRCLPMHTFVKY